MKDLLTPRTPLSQEELDRAVGQQGTEFGKGMRSSTLSMRQGMSNAMGAVGDAAGYSDFAQDQYQQADALGLRAQNSAPRVTSFRDINRVGDAVDWGMGVAGGLLPSAAVGVGAGLMTGGAAVPAMLAGTAAYAPFEVGEVVGRQREAGQPVSLRDAGISGLGSAALQSIVPAGLAGKAMGQVAKVPGRTLKGAVLRDGLTEGVAETGGEFAKQLGSTQTLDTLDTGAGLDAFAGGVLGGGLMGGAGHVVQHGPAGVKALGQGLDTAKNAATGLLGRAKGAAKAAGESDLGQKAVGAAEGLVDLGEKAVAGAKDLGAAAQKTYEGYEIPKKLSEVWDKVRGGTERTLEQIANSDNVIGDTAKFATAQKDKLTGMFTENDNQRIEAVKQAAADLIKEKLTPDQQQALQTFAADVSDRTSQAKVASIKLAKTGAKAAVSALQRFTQLVSEKRAQLKTGDSKVKKSEDYSALEDGIMQELAPALFEARPDLATEVDEDTMRGAARALRLTIRDLAAGDRPSTAALTALLDAVGPEHVTNVLKAAERAIGTTDKKETDRIFKGLLMVDDLMAEKATLLKTLRASLKPGLPYRVTDEMLRNDADGLAAWQDHYKANSNDPKSQLLDREMRAALAERYGDKAGVVLEMADAHKYKESNILAGVMGEDEARPGREAENVIETDAPETGIRKKGVSDQEDFVATKSNDEYGLYPKPGAPTKARDGKTYPHRTVAAIERMKGRHGDMPVRWVSAEELGWDHPEIKAVLDKKVELLLDDSSDLTRAEAEEMARRSMKDKGLVVAEGSRQETRINDNELDSIRWETEFEATPAQLKLPGPGGKGKVLIDAVKLTDLMRKRLHKGDDNWLPGEAKRPLARKARMFKEGIAALQVHLGHSFNIPDETVIDKTGTTWGAVKNEKLPIKDRDWRYERDDLGPDSATTRRLAKKLASAKRVLAKAEERGDQEAVLVTQQAVDSIEEQLLAAQEDIAERQHAAAFDDREYMNEGVQRRDPFGQIHKATVGEYDDGTDEVKSEIRTNLTGLTRAQDTGHVPAGAGTVLFADHKAARISKHLSSRPANKRQQGLIGEAASKLRSTFHPELGSVLFAVHNADEGMPAARITHNEEGNGVISLRADILRGQDPAPGVTHMQRLQRIMAHELAHEADRIDGWPSERSKGLLPGGKVYREAQNVSDERLKGMYANVFDGTRADNINARELYAQLMGLYHSHPELMREQQPLAYATLDKITAERAFDFYQEKSEAKSLHDARRSSRVPTQSAATGQERTAIRRAGVASNVSDLNLRGADAEQSLPSGEQPFPPRPKDGPGAGATKGPKAVAAKKAALQKAASSGDPALLKELASSNDAKGLQRAVQTLVEGKSDANTDAAIDAANKRLGELVSGSEHVAYGMGIKKYSLMRTGDAANDDSPVLRFPDRKGERMRAQIESLMAELSPEDLHTLQNDVLARDPNERRLPSMLRERFRDWVNDNYDAYEREGMMSPERQGETEREFLEEMIDDGQDEPLVLAMARAHLSGATLKEAGTKKYSLMQMGRKPVTQDKEALDLMAKMGWHFDELSLERFSTRSRETAWRAMLNEALTIKDIRDASRLNDSTWDGKGRALSHLNRILNAHFDDTVGELRRRMDGMPKEMDYAREEFGEMPDTRTAGEKARDKMESNAFRLEVAKMSDAKIEELAAIRADDEVYQSASEANDEGENLSDKAADAIREREYKREYDRLVKQREAAQNGKDPVGIDRFSVGPKKYSLVGFRLHSENQYSGFPATHDSPIRHEGRFDWRAHAGKGEGVMAKGAGTYLSTNDQVHKFYKGSFTAKVEPEHNYMAADRVNKQFIKAVGARTEVSSDAAKIAVEKGKGEAVAFVQQTLNDHFKDGPEATISQAEFDKWTERYEKLLAAIQAMPESEMRPKRIDGFRNDKSPTYEVSVNIPQEQLLDWDKPLSEQSTRMQEVAKKVAGEGKIADLSLKWKQDADDLYTATDPDTFAIYTIQQVTPSKFILTDGIEEIVGIYSSLEQAKHEAEKVTFAGPDSDRKILNYRGEDFYRALSDHFAPGHRNTGDRQASDYLQAAGILGHRMKASAKDGVDRPNYVIYDDSKVTTNYVHFSRMNGYTSTIDEITIHGKVWDFGGGKAVEAERASFYDDAVPLKGKVYYEGFTQDGDQISGWADSLSAARAEMDRGGVKTNKPVRAQNRDGGFADSMLSRMRANPGNAQGPAPDQKAIEAELIKMLGPQIDVQWLNIMHAGEHERMGGGNAPIIEAIRLSVHSLNPLGPAYHESVHALFAKLTDLKQGQIMGVLEKAAQSAPVLNQLRTLLKDHPDALAQLSDPEERVAYMFQFWNMRDADGKRMLQVGEHTKNIFEKIADFIRSVLNIWSNDEHALHIMEYFQRGDFAKDLAKANPRDAVERSAMLPAQNKTINELKKMTEPFRNLGEALMVAGHQRLRDTGIPALRELADAMKLHGAGEGEDPGFVPAARAEHAQRMNAVATKLHGISEGALTAALESLQTKLNDPIAALATNEERQAARKAKAIFRDHLDAMFDYMRDAGVKVNDLGYGKDYFPHVYDPVYLSTHQQEFMEVLDRHSVSNSAKVLNKLMTADGNEFTVEVDKPGMQHIKPRVLAHIPDAELAPFMRKNVYEILSSYTQQAARRAEWARRFQDDGRGINALLHKAKLQGATDEQLATAQKFIRGVDGTLGDTINPEARRLMGNMIVYQNVRLLPLAIFSSVVDPMGVLVRGGTVGDAFSTFKRGMKELVKAFKEDPSSDEATQLAAAIGTIDHAMLAHTMSAAYTQGLAGNTARKINDWFFRYNFIEQFNTSMRVGATEAALKFLERHAFSPNKHSERYLAELGLTRKDVRIGPSGRVKVTVADGLTEAQATKMMAAVNRWVDGAVLRPDAVDQPIWMNDARFVLVAHLKRFTFSFHETIIKRVIHEYKNGNYQPAFALASYVPVMIAADLAKGMIQGAGDEPEWKANWGVSDYIFNGIERAGLLGTGQFAADALQYGVGGLAGPTLEQLGRAAQVLGGKAEFAPLFIKSMPANAVYAGLLDTEEPDPKVTG